MALTSAEQAQADQLQTDLDSKPPHVVARALGNASQTTRDAAARSIAFEGVPQKDRTRLYLTLMYMLAILAAGGLVGGAVALLNKVDSAAFFTFAGIALGGLTALFASSPSGK